MSAWLGSRYYPIPYKWGRILAIFGLMGLTYTGIWFCAMRADATWMRLVVNTILIGTYGALMWVFLRRRPVVGSDVSTS